MNIKISELKNTLEQLAKRYVSPEEATYFAEEITESYIRKYPRSNVLKDEVLSDVKRQEKYKDNSIKIVKELPSLIRLDFNHLPITFKIKYIHDLLIEKAKNTGISILAFDNSGGMHSLHTWAQGLAKRGYFAFGSYNGGPNGVVPFNGTQGLFGTNPLTYGFPTEEGNVVIDMATSEIPYFEIMHSNKNNIPLKENVAVDTQGIPTTDASKALLEDGTSNLLPMGGNYKGYAINYLMEIMTGALIGAKLSTKQDPEYVNEDHGGFLIVIDINSFSDLATFKKEVSEFNNVIRSQKAVEGKKIIIPGDNNYERLKIAESEGSVKVDESIWNQIKELLVN